MPTPAAFLAVFDTPMGAVARGLGPLVEAPETLEQLAEVSRVASNLAHEVLSEVFEGLVALGHTEEEALGSLLAWQVEVYLVASRTLLALDALEPSELARRLRACGSPPLVRLNSHENLN